MLRRTLVIALGLSALSACQAPPAALGPGEVSAGAPVLSGRLEAPGYGVRAASSDVLGQALVIMSDAAGATVAAGTTDAAGRFTLYRSTSPYAPIVGAEGVLSVNKRVGGPDGPLLTLCTEVKREAGAWNSISGTDIVINLTTSAITRIDEQDAALAPADVMDKLKDAEAMAFGAYGFADVEAVRETMTLLLGADRDPATVRVHHGDFGVHDADDAAALAAYDGLSGSLTVGADCPLTALDLPKLRYVHGDLILRGTQLSGLWGLSGLRHVRDLTIADNAELFMLNGLEGLRALRNLSIEGNAHLWSLAPLSQLGAIEESARVTDNPQLVCESLAFLRPLFPLGSENLTVYGNGPCVE